DQKAVLDHMGEGLAWLDVPGKGQEHRAGGVLELRVGDHHVEDRLRGIGDLAPDAQCLEQPSAGGDDRRPARIPAGPDAKRRIGYDDMDIRAKSLAQRQRQGQPRKRAAADDNASLCRHLGPAYALLLLVQYSWVKQVHQTRPAAVIPPSVASKAIQCPKA